MKTRLIPFCPEEILKSSKCPLGLIRLLFSNMTFWFTFLCECSPYIFCTYISSVFYGEKLHFRTMGKWVGLIKRNFRKLLEGSYIPLHDFSYPEWKNLSLKLILIIFMCFFQSLNLLSGLAEGSIMCCCGVQAISFQVNDHKQVDSSIYSGIFECCLHW